ncbi:MAG: aa3-type cytochrome c oxidase subunit IV [Hyphomicrobiaceae bacterium]|nr:aa3-type cytochrome c oxidase subunit IV [Hyphomicrobiaceae bacterium]MCC0010649.1 aa3-type cytochrome c oxidase subunit IV [Hyphomicrobiaceae bacterium]
MSIDTSTGHKDMDYREHTRTYAGFLLMTKVLIISVAAILIGMGIFLVH